MGNSVENLLVSRQEMLDRAAGILEKVGTPRVDARSVAESLVQAQEAGHASHGVIRLVEYVSFVKNGTVIPNAAPEVHSDRGASVVVEGNWGWGPVACKFALEIAKRKIKDLGTVSIAVRHVNHIGRLGEYVEELAELGLVSLMWCNSDPSVAAFGGKERLFGTNPFAAGIPTTDSPIVIDFATAASAEGKLRVARANNQNIGAGIVIDKDGKESLDPQSFYDGGSLLPFGGHKGYCMSLMIELLGGAISGGHPSTSTRFTRGNGTVLIVMDPEFFVPRESFEKDISESISKIRNTPPIKADSPVMLPGDVENFQRRKNQPEITISKAIWESILELEESI
jgi:uncharacterized oxidoreductase